MTVMVGLALIALASLVRTWRTGRAMLLGAAVTFALAVAVAGGGCKRLDQAEAPRVPEPESWWARGLLGIARAWVCEEPVDAGVDGQLELDGCYTVDNEPGLTDCGAP